MIYYYSINNMVEYTCTRCYKTFNQERYYINHMNRTKPCQMKPKFTYMDLFSGIGGFHQALQSMNCQCILACDTDKACRENYNHPSFANLPAWWSCGCYCYYWKCFDCYYG